MVVCATAAYWAEPANALKFLEVYYLLQTETKYGGQIRIDSPENETWWNEQGNAKEAIEFRKKQSVICGIL